MEKGDGEEKGKGLHLKMAHLISIWIIVTVSLDVIKNLRHNNMRRMTFAPGSGGNWIGFLFHRIRIGIRTQLWLWFLGNWIRNWRAVALPFVIDILSWHGQSFSQTRSGQARLSLWLAHCHYARLVALSPCRLRLRSSRNLINLTRFLLLLVLLVLPPLHPFGRTSLFVGINYQMFWQQLSK